MKIETKYNKGNRVYFLDKGDRNKFTIRDFLIDTIKVELCSNNKDNVKYYDCNNYYNFSENELFKTKQELKDYLKQKIDEL